MIDAWIPLTLFAATAQTVRFMLQKHLKSTRLSTAGASFARFLYGAPIIVVIVLLYSRLSGQPLPDLPDNFFAPALVGAIAQIIGTVSVVTLFTLRNFAVGTTFMKTEVLLSVPIGYLWLGDTIGPWALVAILIGLVGVLLLSDPQKPASARAFLSGATAVGVLSGVSFAISAVGYRGATLSLSEGDAFLRATVTLSFVCITQVIVLGAWLLARESGEFTRVLQSWRVAAMVGVTSILGSVGWFTAFALQQVAYVKALGQIEVLLSVLASYFVFKETITKREVLGLFVLVFSVILLVLMS